MSSPQIQLSRRRGWQKLEEKRATENVAKTQHYHLPRALSVHGSAMSRQFEGEERWTSSTFLLAHPAKDPPEGPVLDGNVPINGVSRGGKMQDAANGTRIHQ
jgi:hypothetical protein